uniref:Uncharacterized protein n=1 Tax=Anguilla anguilla TaxID=7936 RepID=A0A0E9TWC2_ANGAN
MYKAYMFKGTSCSRIFTETAQN